MNLKFNHQVLRFDNLPPRAIGRNSESIAWLDSVAIVRHEDIFVFDRFKPKGELVPLPGHDKTGLECSINHFHVNCNNGHEAIGTAIIIFAKVHAVWQRSLRAETGTIRQIATIAPVNGKAEGFELSYRFHLIRSAESWLCSDLDKYEEMVLVSE